MLVLANEATASRRRVYFQLVDATDGITPETGEAAGQPQISTDGAAWTNTGIGTLTAIGNGRYYADLTQAAVLTAGTIIETRYKSAATAEAPGDTYQVIAFSLVDAERGASGTALPGIASGSAGAVITSGTGISQLSVTGGTGNAQVKGMDVNTLTASALATDAVTEIQTGLATSSALSTVQADTDDIQTRLPAALVGGRIDSSVGAMAANSLTASALASDAASEIATSVNTTVLAESYATDGATATSAQLLYMIWSRLAEFAITGTTITAKKLDGTTTSMTLTMDNASAPTSVTRAT